MQRVECGRAAIGLAHDGQINEQVHRAFARAGLRAAEPALDKVRALDLEVGRLTCAVGAGVEQARPGEQGGELPAQQLHRPARALRARAHKRQRQRLLSCTVRDKGQAAAVRQRRAALIGCVRLAGVGRPVGPDAEGRSAEANGLPPARALPVLFTR